MAISYESIGQVCITCTNSGAAENVPCKIIYNNSISSCLDGNAIHGVVVATRGSLATVAISGFVTLPYTGTAPTLGFCPLAAASSGKVKKLDGAHEYLVISVDTTSKTVTFLL